MVVSLLDVLESRFYRLFGSFLKSKYRVLVQTHTHVHMHNSTVGTYAKILDCEKGNICRQEKYLLLDQITQSKKKKQEAFRNDFVNWIINSVSSSKSCFIVIYANTYKAEVKANQIICARVYIHRYTRIFTFYSSSCPMEPYSLDSLRWRVHTNTSRFKQWSEKI